MKRFSIIALVLLLASCGGSIPQTTSEEISSLEPTSIEEESTLEQESVQPSESEETTSELNYSFEEFSVDPVDDDPNFSIQDAPILHAWDWSVTQIISALDDIQKANFKAIQLSPLQPSKNPSAGAEWWNLYQPMGFKVATGNENPLGTKTQLTELCRKAEEKGIKIVMDVVTNHLAQGDKFKLFTHAESWSGNKSVGNFESEIVNNNLIHNVNYYANDGSVESVVHGSLGGLPDLQTENSKVQERVISMLREYIDCGVKGFRFDAAKHIETPYDGSCASSFWSNVIGSINEYGQLKYNENPYVYGEILNTPGGGRSWDNYTRMMSVVDNKQGETILWGVYNKDAGRAASSYYNIGSADKAVLWAESHDTYANDDGTTTFLDTKVVNLAYAIQISRKDATALFFARPDRFYGINKTPQVVDSGSSDYKSKLVSGANKFHNDFVGGSEYVAAINNVVTNYRVNKTGNNEGILIADPNMNKSTTFTASRLSDGQYTDLITGKKYDISNSLVNVELTDGACILEKNTTGDYGPTINIRTEDNKTVFEDSLEVRIDVVDAVEAYYKINGEIKGQFTNNIQFSIPSSAPVGKYEVQVYARNEKGTVSTSFITLKKVNYNNKIVILENVPEEVNIVAWIWVSGGQGHWVDMDIDGTTYSLSELDLLEGEDMIIFTAFPEGITAANADWSLKIAQTENLQIATRYFDFNEI